ncbi:MAG: hypothetical protein ACK54K_02305 [Gemmatimonadaceae bacterium]
MHRGIRRALVLWGGLLAPCVAGAQRAPARLGAPEGVQLTVRPRVGDTLRLQVEQTVEMHGRRVSGATVSGLPGTRGTAPEPAYGPRADRANSRLTRLQLFAHSLVEASDLSVTTLLATTDSITMWAGSPGDAQEPQAMAVPEDARQVRVRVTPDGAMRLSDPPPGATTLGRTLASVPGLLPVGPVTVGSVWTRDMVLPSLPLSGFRAAGVVQARLRLDSLTRGGRDAWISISGLLRREGAARELPAGTRIITAGTIRGTMHVDRERAWIVDARTVLDVQSEVAPGPAATGTPMLLDLRIVQQVRVR